MCDGVDRREGKRVLIHPLLPLRVRFDVGRLHACVRILDWVGDSERAREKEIGRGKGREGKGGPSILLACASKYCMHENQRGCGM
jgi:hypothetical protein